MGASCRLAVCTDRVGSTGKSLLRTDKIGTFPCFRAPHDGLVDSLEYFGRQIFSNDLTTYKVVERGQFAYATNHIEEGSIGYQAYHDAALISPMYTVFQPVDQVDDDFLFRVLKTEKYRHIFEINTSGTVDAAATCAGPISAASGYLYQLCPSNTASRRCSGLVTRGHPPPAQA